MARGGPVFVLGMIRRSGTNFLHRLLIRHPDVQGVTILHEDFMLHDAQLLCEYARRTRALWNPTWKVGPDAEERLVRALGGAVYSFLRDVAFEPPCRDDRRPLFKTPSVANLEHFFEFFPDASLLILVRDGRDVVESGVRSFGSNHEFWTRAWCKGAQTVLDFDRQHRGHANYRLVRYEDIVRDLVGQMREILTFLGLDLAVYDFEAARNLPVFGSSTSRGSQTKVHWKPVSKTEDFNPIGRWQGWSRYRQRRFEWSAGELMRGLGYDLDSALVWWEPVEQRLVDATLPWKGRLQRAIARGRSALARAARRRPAS